MYLKVYNKDLIYIYIYKQKKRLSFLQGESQTPPDWLMNKLTNLKRVHKEHENMFTYITAT